jgi:hypothetical protein
LDIFELLKGFAFGKPESSVIPDILNEVLTCYIRLFFCNGEFPSSSIDILVKKGAFSKVRDFLKTDWKLKSEKKEGMCTCLLHDTIYLFFNISREGSLYSPHGMKNTHFSLFDSETEQILLEIHKSLSFSKEKHDYRETVIFNFIPIILINIHKNEECPPSFLPHLSIVHSMMTQPTPIEGEDMQRWAKLSYEGILQNK